MSMTQQIMRKMLRMRTLQHCLTTFMRRSDRDGEDDVYIIKLERNVPQRIRMFIWLEGQDVDCVNYVSTSSLVVNLELAGASEELE